MKDYKARLYNFKAQNDKVGEKPLFNFLQKCMTNCQSIVVYAKIKQYIAAK